MSEPAWVALGSTAHIDYEGAWAAGTPYMPGDVVAHNGAQYLAVNPSLGTTPSGGPTTTTPVPVVGIGTALPVSPLDGEEFILVDSLTAPTYQWLFRYAASITDAYKWVFVGGAPACSEVQSLETGASATYAEFATPGPQITLPRAGNYLVNFNVELYLSAVGQAVWVVLKRGAAVESDGDSALHQSSTASAPTTSARSILVIGAAAADVMKLRYKTTATASFRKRELRITPQRVA